MEDWISNWSSNPTIVVAVIAVIGLIWQGGRWTGRIENGLKSMCERMDAQRRTLEERIDIGLESLGERMDAQRRTLEERIDTGLKTLREEMRQEHSEPAGRWTLSFCG